MRSDLSPGLFEPKAQGFPPPPQGPWVVLGHLPPCLSSIRGLHDRKPGHLEFSIVICKALGTCPT